MSEDEASVLFSKIYHTDNQPETDIEKGENSLAITQLIEELELLPLTIIQITAYLRENQDDITNYIRIYKRTREALRE